MGRTFFFVLLALVVLLLGGQLDNALSASRNTLVNESSLGGQHLPSIAVSPDGQQIYIAWVDCRNDPTCESDTDIYFARSRDGGVSFDTAVPVSDDETFFANAPKIAADSSGNIYVVWHDNREGDENWNVYLSKLENQGESFSPSVRVNDSISGVDQYEPDLALDSSGNIYVSWNRYYLDGDQYDYDVYMAKSIDGGVTFGTNVKVNDGPDWQYKSSIKVGPTGNVYVTWTDRRNDGISDVYFAKSDNGGVSFSPSIRVNQYTEQSQGYPDMALDEDEVIYVVWNDSRNLYKKNGRDVFMARSLDLGDSFEPEIKINDAKVPAAFEYFYPTITARGKGHVAIAWEDNREGTYDVYLTRSDNGGSSFRPSWRLNSAEKGSQSVPDIVMDGMGYVHCTWRDERSGDFLTYFALDESVKSVVKVLTPNGGEVFSTDEPVTIEWNALKQAVSFDLYYSVDEGSTWKEIIADATSPYPWTLPRFNGNKKQSLVKVVGFDSERNQVGADKSDKPFTIQVVKVTYPSDPDISFTSGIPGTITWEVYPTKSPAETLDIYLTKDGGNTWKRITEGLLPATETYPWTPEVGKGKKQCKVKIVLKDIMGNTIGIDSSDNYFAIELPEL